MRRTLVKPACSMSIATRSVLMAKYVVCGVRATTSFAPSLVTRGPGAATWILGNLEQDDLLIELFDGNGVDRKRDGH